MNCLFIGIDECQGDGTCLKDNVRAPLFRDENYAKADRVNAEKHELSVIFDAETLVEGGREEMDAKEEEGNQNEEEKIPRDATDHRDADQRYKAPK